VTITLRSVRPRRAPATPATLLVASALAVSVAGLAVLGPAALAASAGKSPAGHPKATFTPVVRLPAITGLDISVSDGRTRVRPGDLLTYVARVTDAGSDTARDLRISLTFPSYLKFVSAGQHRQVASGKVTWPLTIRPGHTDKFRLKALLTKTPAGVGHLAVVACAADSSGRTLVCAAHLDKVPETASPKQAAKPGTATPASSGHKVTYVVVGLVVLVAALLATVTASLIRARRPRLMRHRHSA
jgi:hypothetical protein